ncbi:MAG: hypothetical protein DHS20C15_34420 [Planctomycetota bacterium]|nr:MAG: hypothetical protein DHS20C15_34420 [Planctomycetota bacterium]
MALLKLSAMSSLAAAIVMASLTPATLAQGDAPMPNPPTFPDENPPIPNQDILGKFLFWEEQVSVDNTVACGTCHIHEAGGSDPRVVDPGSSAPGPDGILGTEDDAIGSRGIVRVDAAAGVYVHNGVFGNGAQVTPRKTPTMINAVYFNELFWDGRAPEAYTDPQTGLVEIPYLGALESQAAGPPLSDVEMGGVNQSWDRIADKLVTAKPLALGTDLPPEMADFLANFPSYPAMFEEVYGTPEITSKRIMFAIANYERTLISDETVLDSFLKGEIDTFPTPGMQLGFDLFQGAANCATCHTLPFAMDFDYHNIGVRPDADDIGRMEVTGDPADIAKFKTPNIRNAKLRGALFHNGSAATVRELVEFYDRGGDFNDGNLDENIIVLNLTEAEIDGLVEFIEDGATDPRVENRLHPFTRPTLRSELPSLNTSYGVASEAGPGEFATILGNQVANLGNSDYLIGLNSPSPNAPAIMALSFLPDPSGTPLPDPRNPVPVNLDLGTLVLRQATMTDANGMGTFALPINNNPVLAGLNFYAQWFVYDVAAVATGGVYGTEGLEVTIL